MCVERSSRKYPCEPKIHLFPLDKWMFQPECYLQCLTYQPVSPRPALWFPDWNRGLCALLYTVRRNTMGGHRPKARLTSYCKASPSSQARPLRLLAALCLLPMLKSPPELTRCSRKFEPDVTPRRRRQRLDPLPA
jgi:hypothetical protein